MNIIQTVKEYVLSVNNEYAAKEIVELGALLHDIALMTNTGIRSEHHINGKIIAEHLLSHFDYPSDKKERVLNCILHHRSSKNAENIEELCVADADFIAHFDNIPMCLNGAYRKNIISIPALIDYFAGDYSDLSDKTKETFNPRYENIMNVLFGDFYKPE